MAKKKKTAKRKIKTVPITEKQRLEHLIEVSERAIDGRSGSIDDFFANQAARLRKQLKELNERPLPSNSVSNSKRPSSRR